MVRKRIPETSNQLARKRIRARIRRVLNTKQLAEKIRSGYSDEMNEQLEDDGHQVNRLFNLARLDQSNMDHWRALTFVLVHEIFGDITPGAPAKDQTVIKHFILLYYLNEIHRQRAHNGWPNSVIDAAMDMPVFLSNIKDESGPSDMNEPFEKMKVSTIERYLHAVLTRGQRFLEKYREYMTPDLREEVEKALDNFRPGWRTVKTAEK